MSQRTDSFDLARLKLASGQGRRLDLVARIQAFEFGEEPYALDPPEVPVRVDVSRTTGNGWSLRLRFEAHLTGACMRCLGRAEPDVAVDVREVDQPGAGDEELKSPYVADEVLDLAGWARDGLLLALPSQIVCRADCAGLCPDCGADLNEAGPGHFHEREPDPRWAKLRELGL